MNFYFFNFWDILAFTTIIACPIVMAITLIKLIWLIAIGCPKEKRREEAFNNALNKITQE